MTGILEICKEVADITAAQRPDDLFDKNMLSDAIFLSIAKNELDSLMRYGDWQVLIKKGCFQTIRDRHFYPFDEIVSDFYALIHNTIYIKNDREQVIGALTAEEWMREKYLENVKTNLSFRVENNGFRLLGDMPADLKVVFMYRSNAICYDGKTMEEKTELSKNTDVPVFDKYLVKLGLIWRWLKRNGMDYVQEYNEYQKELKKKFGLEQNVKDIILTNNFDSSCVFSGVIEHQRS